MSKAVPAAVSPVHGRLALAGMALAVAIAADLHLRLSAQVSPVWQTLSEYVYGHLGGRSAAPLFSAMCLALALGSVALLAGLVKARRSPAVVVLLGVWCAGLTICATVPVDPDGQARTFDGQLHNGAAITAFLALPAAAWLLTRRGTPKCPWEPRRSTIRGLAVASVASVLIVLGGFVFELITGPAQQEVTLGLFERLLFCVDLALLLTMVRPLLAAARR
ncbi:MULTISPECIES: DUF998 domain-containing protein [unclassified Amycolatopsis]|uniref:DUF998 domain-containing protein n=1 Tax=unclassified Amycolatopsis TaxID=2618356 RepID=UPI001C698682|nr:DUF998 domain-containing protein [Amycolatopsis sp. DSM 110486]QYN24321.1 DUF998 domain-containing protein [Amycolatopsis sp. DSM 110486]